MGKCRPILTSSVWAHVDGWAANVRETDTTDRVQPKPRRSAEPVFRGAGYGGGRAGAGGAGRGGGADAVPRDPPGGQAARQEPLCRLLARIAGRLLRAGIAL